MNNSINMVRLCKNLTCTEYKCVKSTVNIALLEK